MVFTPRNINSAPTASVSTKRRLMSLFLMVSLVGVIGAYIALTNGVATQGYKIEKLANSIEELKITKQKLEAQAAELQSVKTLENGDIPEGYIAVQRVEYLAATPQVGVAVK